MCADSLQILHIIFKFQFEKCVTLSHSDTICVSYLAAMINAFVQGFLLLRS